MLRYPKSMSSNYLIEKVDGVNLVWIKTRPYEKVNGILRIYNWVCFALATRSLDRICGIRPDIVMYSSPSLIGYLGAKSLTNKLDIPLIFEVRDVWPQTLCTIGGVSKKHPFIRFMQWIEDYAYKNSTHVISNLPNVLPHMVRRGLKKNKFTLIPNGYSKDDFYSNCKVDERIASLIPKNKFVVGYAGTVGKANALSYLIDAAEQLKLQKEIVFVIVGGGSEKQNLVESTESKCLSNIIFIDAVPKLEVSSVLSLFDICYLGWHKSDLYEFGIAANKLAEYLLAKKPILHSYSGALDPVRKFNCGITVPAEDSIALASAVSKMKSMPCTELKSMGMNGFNAVIHDFEYENLAGKLNDVFINAINK